MHAPLELRCHAHGETLVFQGMSPDGPSSLECQLGCRWPVMRGIPRFVNSENYASAFGLQWNAFKKTQLDSYTGLTISRDRLTRCLGGSLDVVRGKSVLEAGCGAGRFTETLLAAGAHVFACDLSDAVDANYANCSRWPDYFVCQADIRQLPVPAESFDVVLCLGVIQHTPKPEATIAALARYVKPGGMLVIDHYGTDYPYPASRVMMRNVIIRLPPRIAMRTALAVAKMFLPLHQMLWTDKPAAKSIRRRLSTISPLVDYYEIYPQLRHSLLAEWAILDTHDTLTDRYKHLRSVDHIRDALRACGLTDIEAYPGGNGVEARSRRALGLVPAAAGQGHS